jgi:hypothetical protein
MVASACLAGGGGPARAAARELSDTPASLVATAAPSPPVSRRPALAAAYLAVPLDSPLYDDLEHFRALGFWRGSLEMRPVRRRVFTRAAASIRAASGKHHLSSRDELRLRRLEAVVQGWRRVGHRQARLWPVQS